jgi:hypothetical protein
MRPTQYCIWRGPWRATATPTAALGVQRNQVEHDACSTQQVSRLHAQRNAATSLTQETGGGGGSRPVGPCIRASVALAMRRPRARAHERVIACRKTDIHSRHALLPRSIRPAGRPSRGVAAVWCKRGQLGPAKRRRVVHRRHLSIRCACLARLHAWCGLECPARLCASGEQHTSTTVCV